MSKFIYTKIGQYLRESLSDIRSDWYRAYTTNTKDSKYIWITSSEDHAKQYADINKYSYGGEPIVSKFELDEDSLNLNNLYSYDMDDNFSESDIESFLIDVDVDYDWVDLFDIMEDEIPLSRLVNKILDELVDNYDGIKIMENGIKTIYLKKKLIT